MTWTTPRTWVAGEVPTAADFNTHIRDNFKAIGDPWPAFTPTLSGWTLGNGNLSGTAIMLGKWVQGRIIYTVGSTDTLSGVISFNLPATAVAAHVELGVGQAGLWDLSATARQSRTAFLANTTTLQLQAQDGTRVTHLAPWTWDTGDKMLISFSYEAA